MRRLLMAMLILTALPFSALCQFQVQGKIKEKTGFVFQPGVSIARLSNGEILTTTDSLGNYSFQVNALPLAIVISYPSCNTDTVTIADTTYRILNITKLYNIGKASVSIQGSGSRSSHIGLHTVKTEIITQGELKKAACCDLAGCFETQGTVQPMTTNIITNAKELRILGLSGVYNQVLTDGFPMIQGLTYTYGISSYPGTMVDNITVAKGNTSVLQGYESMVGQINLIPKKTDKDERMLLNVYANSFGETQYNVGFRSGKKKLTAYTALHMVQPAATFDRDKDKFMDVPKLTRYLIYEKIKFGDAEKKGFSMIAGARFLKETRLGGQTNYRPTDTGSTSIYGQFVNYRQGDAYLKAAYRFTDNKKISLMSSGVLHRQNSWYGTVAYQGRQNNGYANAQYEWNWGNGHDLKTGVSYRYLAIEENLRFSDTLLKRGYAGQYNKYESIPGLFAENTFKWRGDIITLITGIRADHHNIFGWQVTPRTMLKYDVTENAIIRASAGTGWRTVNLFSENPGLMASSRDIVFLEFLKPEKAFNWGLSFFNKIKGKKLEGFYTLDFYQTRFSNQFFPDYDSDPTKAYIKNFTGPSVSNGFQTDINTKYRKQLEFKVAYNFLYVYRVVENQRVELPFNAKHKFLTAISYLPLSKKWRADVNIHWFGQQRLPNTQMNPEEYRQTAYSKAYTTFNIQATRSWKKIELYGGCENLFDYRQLRPIVSWQNPFSPYFDTSFNWGPTRGREIFAGIRYKPFN